MGVAEAAVRAVRWTSRVYDELVSAREAIDCGYAYTCEEFPDLSRCNFVGEVWLDDLERPAAESVAEHFAARRVPCHGWVPAEGQEAEEVGRIALPLGFERYETRAFVLARAASPAAPRLRVIGARAMRRAYTRVAAHRARLVGAAREQALACQLRRLEEPQYDAFVALEGDEPVGMVSVLQVGPQARLCDLYVLPERRRQGVGTGLLLYAIATARRWSLSPICAAAPADSAEAAGVLERAGFAPGGMIVGFRRPGVVEVSG